MLWRYSVTGCIVLSACLFIPSLCNAAEKGAPVAEPSLDRIEERLDNIERLLQNQGLLDMLQQIQRLQQEVTDLRGQIEVNSHKLETLEDKQRKLYTDIDNRLQRIGQQNSAANTAETETSEPPPLKTIEPADTAVPAGNEAESTLTVENVATDTQKETGTQAETETQAEPEKQTETGPVTTVDTGEETLQPPATTVTEDDALKAQANYQQAFSLLKKADYDQAISAFDTFLRKYPDSQYSDNAQYWMGEAYYVTRRFNEAITEYMKLVTNYPDSQKVPNSLLKIGYSYLELGQRDEARKVLEDLINRFPGTNAAQDAQQKLNKSPTT